jgi:hypothetical protein
MRARLLVSLVALLLAACGDDPPAAPPAAAAPTSEALAEHFRALVKAAQAQDVEALKGLVGAMIPSRAELAGLLKPGPDADAWLAAYEGPTTETFKPDEAPKSGLGSSTRTEIHVHRATTEELAAYVKGTVAFAEFPGGMKDFARTLAAPGRAWWCVEAVEPGKDSGTRFTAFTDVAGRFVLVVKPWRALRRTEPPAAEGPAETPEPGK